MKPRRPVLHPLHAGLPRPAAAMTVDGGSGLRRYCNDAGSGPPRYCNFSRLLGFQGTYRWLISQQHTENCRAAGAPGQGAGAVRGTEAAGARGRPGRRTGSSVRSATHPIAMPMYFVSRNSSIPVAPPSLPSPDSLTPPKGAAGLETTP